MPGEGQESSAAPADLQEFVDGVSDIRRTFSTTLDELETRWSTLAAGNDYAPYTNPIEDTRGIATQWGERQDFVATVREAFIEADSYDPDAPAGSVITIPSSTIEALLERTTSERIEDFEQDLIANGVPETEAAKIAANAEELLESDPSLTFSDAILQAAADHAGVTVEEYEQRLRALQMPRAEAAQILEENFEQVAERTGDSDTISIEDLQEIIADPTVDQEVRDAAFKIAADADLFLDLDTAAQTDVIASLDGVNRDGSNDRLPGKKSHEIDDGEISRKDLEQFPEKDFLIDTVSAWLPAIDTANEDYNIGKSDGNITQDDVDAFLADESIPEHVRIAVYQTFERQFVLQNRAHYGLGAATILEITRTAPPAVPRAPGGPKPKAPTTPKPTAPAGPKGGGPRGGGYLLAAIIGWEVGQRAAPELFPNVNKDTTIRVRDPITGNPTTIDGTIVEQYPADQRTAVIEYIAATGKPPPPEFDPTEKRRFTYYHPKKGWVWADTHEPVPGHPPVATYKGDDGIWRYAHSGEPVDGGEPVEVTVHDPAQLGFEFGQHLEKNRPASFSHAIRAEANRYGFTQDEAVRFIEGVLITRGSANRYPLPDGRIVMHRNFPGTTSVLVVEPTGQVLVGTAKIVYKAGEVTLENLTY